MREWPCSTLSEMPAVTQNTPGGDGARCRARPIGVCFPPVTRRSLRV